MNRASFLPLVSVVFTSYNHESFVQIALESIIAQSYPELEIIVIDDFSTDGSRDILKQYAAAPRVELHLLESNTGSYVKSSNLGATFAKGEYLLFAQCDDFAHPDQIELLIEVALQQSRAGVVWSKSNMIDRNGVVFEDDFEGREKKFRDRCSQNTLLSGSEMRRFLSHSCVIPNLSAALVRRDLYIKAGGLSEKYFVAADWAFWLTLSELTDFYYITTPLNNFRQHENTIRNSIKMERQILEIYSIFYEHLKDHKLKGKEARSLRRGAGFVWFSFIFDGLEGWIKSFPAVVNRSFLLDRKNILYLINGVMLYGREVVYNRLKSK